MELQTVHIRKILYATDLSETAVHAFSYAVSLASLYDANLTILHVLSGSPMEPYVFNMIDSDTWKAIRERQYDEVQDKLIGKRRDGMAMREVLKAFFDKAKSVPENRPFVSDNIMIESGVAADVIVNTAKERQFDLIVMGTHGVGGIAGALVGSTAKRVVRESVIPVLVVRLT